MDRYAQVGLALRDVGRRLDQFGAAGVVLGARETSCTSMRGCGVRAPNSPSPGASLAPCCWSARGRSARCSPAGRLHNEMTLAGACRDRGGRLRLAIWVLFRQRMAGHDRPRSRAAARRPDRSSIRLRAPLCQRCDAGHSSLPDAMDSRDDRILPHCNISNLLAAKAHEFTLPYLRLAAALVAACAGAGRLRAVPAAGRRGRRRRRP